jgi:murein DD-endopeptidase MepM/ murein hydrolase activator NlpD
VANAHGVKSVTATVEQNGAVFTMSETTAAPVSWRFSRNNEAPRDYTVTVGKKAFPGLKDGKARLRIAAQSNDLRGSTAEVALDVVVSTRPPSVVADSFQHYINQGGCELVTFTVSGDWIEAGVKVGNYRFRSFPLPGKGQNTEAQERFSLFAVPWDAPADAVPVVYARNAAGNEAEARFWFKLFPKQFRTRPIEIPDSFLNKVVNQIEPGGQGTLIERFLRINGQLRKANNAEIAGLRAKTVEHWAFREAFQQLGNSKVESLFADTRDYIYNGQKVDRQTHLGYDLSVTQGVGVTASNDGTVVLARNLGIYGNCIVVDHGYGLQSIYAHLSRIEVKEGDAVKRGQEMGKSGSTGLAGGDHLHFSMQVDGVQVTPLEWFDQHWLEDRIFSKVPAKSE